MPGQKSTKEKIFFAALDCFAKDGYEHVSMQDLAEHLGITLPAVKKYFKTKEDILNEIINYYHENYNKYRTPVDEIISKAESHPMEEIIPLLFYSFGNEPESITMMNVIKIILSVRIENEHAKKIFQQMYMYEPVAYLHSVFETLIEKGRIKKFDYKTYSFQIMAFCQTILMMSLFDSKHLKDFAGIQKNGIKMFADSFKMFDIEPKKETKKK